MIVANDQDEGVARAQNYYLVLGVESDATDDELRNAYRQRVMEYHPDYYGPDAAPFLEVQEAYNVLGDPGRRRAYDENSRVRERRRLARSGATEPLRPRRLETETLEPAETDIDLGEASLTESFAAYHPSLEELFNRLWSNFGSLTRPKAERVESLTVDIPITPAQALWGGRVRVVVPAQARCPSCRGHGFVGPFECWRCAGQGAINREYPVSVAYPPGIVGGHVVQIPLDQYGIHNLYLTVRFRVRGRAE
jgi:molecular chaperone DnaJ